MHRVEWTATARKDLRRIQDYVARDSVPNARRLINKIVAAIEGARQFPSAGSLVPEWEEGHYREVFVGSYRIIYEFDAATIRVVTVVHGAQLLPEQDAQ